MTLDDIKTKRLAVIAAKFAPPASLNESVTTTSGTDTVIEGKQHNTPEFVRHCVAAITSKPKTLDRVQQKKDGSPFGVCYATYKKNKRSLAAKHSTGEHHTNKQYEKSLKTLSQEGADRRKSSDSRRHVVFEHVEPQAYHRRRSVRFEAQA